MSGFDSGGEVACVRSLPLKAGRLLAIPLLQSRERVPAAEPAERLEVRLALATGTSTLSAGGVAGARDAGGAGVLHPESERALLCTSRSSPGTSLESIREATFLFRGPNRFTP